ncbi:hypothetical protein KQ51_01486 [Candidatus Izimaplasma bacterium HR1]|jgi:membrane protein YdbS with pleckstrin-like domain|uniref:hypothetical protein n=1 Tax=Candidatus Izimoplasma sp. HR1 TaxID=1541959 RepID=UPI0004F82B3C|nr:hypothetical protein KQ51_01486 [Candidatus Izimaplasma bacterium HR1]
MKSECPKCKEKTISYGNRITMHGSMGTHCPKCNADLGTTRLWNVLLILLIPVSIMVLGPLVRMEEFILTYVALGVLVLILFVIYAVMPLVEVKKKEQKK